jgi:hypothetical protein
MNGALSGYKTVIVCLLAVAGAVLGYLDGDISKIHAGQLVLNAVLGLTLRDAIRTSTSAL